MHNTDETVMSMSPEEVMPAPSPEASEVPSEAPVEAQEVSAAAPAPSQEQPQEPTIEAGSGEEVEASPAASFGDLELEASNEDSEALAAAIAENQRLLEKIKSLELQLEQRNEQYVRIAADFENFRKRTQKEKEDLQEQIKCNTLVEVLPVLDNFERAKDHLKPQTEEGIQVHKSYQGLYKQFVESLKRVGVSPMRAEGKPFDPMLHDAMLREATAEYEEGTVMLELQRGYMLGERVLRHAMVKVAAPPEPEAADGEG
ncbi:MAG: nucleotide exchange factor GrpE [Prochlorothrix sp.]